MIGRPPTVCSGGIIMVSMGKNNPGFGNNTEKIPGS